MARPTALFVIVVALLVTSHAYYVPQLTVDADGIEAGAPRDKRYTDYQENASAFCTGMCMFEERKPYSECFDLCNWTGHGPSPWAKLDAAKSRAAASNGGSSGNSVENTASMMRTGMMRTGTGQRNRGRARGRGGRKKGTTRSY